jgi:predicted O-methyltransferase YrrM
MYDWVTFWFDDDMLNSLASPLKLRPPSRYQDPAELTWFVRLAQSLDVRSYLEIGSRFGDSFYAVMANLRPSARGISIDLPESPEKAIQLTATCCELRTMGFYCAGHFGDSNNSFALKFAKHFAPYDLILIDADHTYEGVAQDWHNYSRFGRVIALHDVAAPDTWQSDGKPNGVGRFWRELKSLRETYSFTDMEEFATPGSNMGYGVVFR